MSIYNKYLLYIKSMKYGNIIYENRYDRMNLGDDIQLLSIENLYNQMGIDYNEVKRINYRELGTYDGEYVILPISFPMLSYTRKQYVTKFSPKIIPVFLGVCILKETFSIEEIAYLKKWEPIGCRDLYTLNNMRKYGIESYLNGCMTLSFPRRNKNIEGSVIYAVDISDNLKKIIPQEIRSEAKFVSQTFYLSDIGKSTPEEFARKMYQKYIDTGKLIITTRLHAALPCIAAGIPTIFLKEEYSYRFAGVDAVVPIYYKDTFDQIDWNPKSIDIESHKREILEIASNRLREAYNKHNSIYSLSERLENKIRPKYHIEYIDNTKKELKDKWKLEETQKYVLWGLTQTTELIYNWISKNYPNAILKGVIDKNKRENFCNVVVACPKEEIEIQKDTYVLVCTSSAIQESRNFCKTNGIKNLYQCCADGIVHEKDLVEDEKN